VVAAVSVAVLELLLVSEALPSETMVQAGRRAARERVIVRCFNMGVLPFKK